MSDRENLRRRSRDQIDHQQEFEAQFLPEAFVGVAEALKLMG
jgi:hypothetical protein